jgi:glycosyltransferase involved in cell wall biosynthesis
VVQLHGPLAMFAERIGWPGKGSDLFRAGTFMEDYSISHADALMACSANIADFTAEYHRVSRAAIDVVHCGVDAESFRPAPDFERAGDCPRILFAGNIALNKGVGVVFESTLRLRAKFPNLQLTLLGKGDDNLIAQLERRAEEHGARDNVRFLGFAGRDQMAELYRTADVFCSPAHHEVGVANVYIEAMACGCPVVACDTGGAPEAVLNGCTGLLVPPNNVEATTAALDRILSDPGLRLRFARAGRERVEAYFAMDKYIGRVLATYERAIEVSQRKLDELRREEGV